MTNMMFGLSDDRSAYDEAIAWREAAVKDGWSIKSTYKHEAVESHASLEKEGFVASVMARELNKSKFKYQADVTVWAPDGLQIRVPRIYSWDKIIEGIHTCNKCGEHGETYQYSFAGRCCAKCLPEMRKQYEQPGWTR